MYEVFFLFIILFSFSFLCFDKFCIFEDVTYFVAEKVFFYYAFSYSVEYDSRDLNVLAYIFSMVLLTIVSKVDTVFQLSHSLFTR